MIIDSFNTSERVFVVAEIGNNHEGGYALAEKLIYLAAQAGVDAVKFQTIVPEKLVGTRNVERIAQLKRFQLTYEEFARLHRVARTAGVLFLSTPFDLESAQFLDAIVPAFKIASGDNIFYPLIRAVAETGKPIILSGGLADMAQLQETHAFIHKIWRDKGFNQELAVLHCVGSYPVPPEQANLGAITHLKNVLGGTIGYSDHTIGIQAATLAVALGARIIEKHFTIDKQYSNFRDHQLSADPQEMTELVRQVRGVSAMLGSGEKVLQECEKGTVVQLRRSIVAKRDLPEGAVIQEDDVTWVRPGGGLPPGSEQQVIGKKLARSVAMGEPLAHEMFCP